MSSSPQPLAGKLALITGASKGIGAATALELSSLGAKVVINYSSDSKPADELVKKIGADKAIAIKANASSIPDIERLVKESVEWGGEGKIDILIASAGMMLLGTDLENTREEDFAKTYDLNVKGPYFLCQVSLTLFSPQSCNFPISAVGDCISHFASQLDMCKCLDEPVVDALAESNSLPQTRLAHRPLLNISLRRINHHTELPTVRLVERRNRANNARARQRSWSQGHRRELHRARSHRYRPLPARQVRPTHQDNRILEPLQPTRHARGYCACDGVFGERAEWMDQWTDFES
jgi:hypothetical protein